MNRPRFGELARSELGLPRRLLKRALKVQRRERGRRRLGRILLELVQKSERVRLAADLERVARMQEVFWPAAGTAVEERNSLVLSVRPFPGHDSGKISRPRHLMVPRKGRLSPDHCVPQKQWQGALWRRGPEVLLFVPGFDNRPGQVMKRHRGLQQRLRRHGFGGALVTFDWLCGRRKGRLRGRSRARLAAVHLARCGLGSLRSRVQREGGRLHVLAHSTGAFLVREAFAMAEQDAPGFEGVQEVVLCGADVDRSMLADSWGAALLRHSRRVTSYHNPHDRWLRPSLYDRPGVGERLGREGWPQTPAPIGVQVDCGDHFRTLKRGKGRRLDHTHCWYFEDRWFAQDLAATLSGSPWPGRWTTRRATTTGRAALGRDPSF